MSRSTGLADPLTISTVTAIAGPPISPGPMASAVVARTLATDAVTAPAKLADDVSGMAACVLTGISGISIAALPSPGAVVGAAGAEVACGAATFGCAAVVDACWPASLVDGGAVAESEPAGLGWSGCGDSVDGPLVTAAVLPETAAFTSVEITACCVETELAERVELVVLPPSVAESVVDEHDETNKPQQTIAPAKRCRRPGGPPPARPKIRRPGPARSSATVTAPPATQRALPIEPLLAVTGQSVYYTPGRKPTGTVAECINFDPIAVSPGRGYFSPLAQRSALRERFSELATRPAVFPHSNDPWTDDREAPAMQAGVSSR